MALRGLQRQSLALGHVRARRGGHHAGPVVAHEHPLRGQHRDIPLGVAQGHVRAQVHGTAQLGDPVGRDGQDPAERGRFGFLELPVRVAEHRPAVGEALDARLRPRVRDVRLDQDLVAVAEGAVDVRHEAAPDLVVLIPFDPVVVAHDHTVVLQWFHEHRSRGAGEELHFGPVGERRALCDDDLAPAIPAKLERLVVAEALDEDPLVESAGHRRSALGQLPAGLRDHEASVARDLRTGVLDRAHHHAAPAEPRDAVRCADDDVVPRQLEPRRRLEASVSWQGREACIRQAQARLGNGLAVQVGPPVARRHQLARGGARRWRVGYGEVRHVGGQVLHGQALARAQQGLALGAREGRRIGLDDGEVAPASHERHGLRPPALLDPAHPLDDAGVMLGLPRVARPVRLAGGLREGPERAERLVVRVLLGLAHLHLSLVGGGGVKALAMRLARAGKLGGALLQALDEGGQGRRGGVVRQGAFGVAREPGEQGVGLSASGGPRGAEARGGAFAGCELAGGRGRDAMGAARRVGVVHVAVALHNALELVIDLRLVLRDVLHHPRVEALIDGVKEALDQLGLCVLTPARGLVRPRCPRQVHLGEALRVEQQALRERPGAPTPDAAVPLGEQQSHCWREGQAARRRGNGRRGSPGLPGG
mmetsp:Transcript_81141/g.250407  ORF Transcript_81141/g.250407 Transcript_81141/m.250407 type:complete len:650 (-) Transcript_81141:1-1950(-)